MTAFNEGERPKGGGPWLIWGIPLVLSLCGLVMIASLSLRNSMTGGYAVDVIAARGPRLSPSIPAW